MTLVKRAKARLLGRRPRAYEPRPGSQAAHLNQPIAPQDAPAGWDVAICAIFKDEADYLEEWIEFHRLVGVEKFILFDHGSTDGSAELLAPYVEAGLVTVYEWPIPQAAQPRAYNKCLDLYRGRVRWLAFIDVDEFLYPVADEPLVACLDRYAEHPGLAVHWIMFTTSGHVLRPEGLQIENYRVCDPAGNKMLKCVVQPERTTRFFIHHGEYVDGALAVDERGRPVDGGTRSPPSVDIIRINHYRIRSVEEYLTGKATKGEVQPAAPGTSNLNAQGLVDLEREFGVGTDDVILRYAPALHRRLRSPRTGANT